MSKNRISLFTLFNYDVDPVLDNVLSKLIDEWEIVSVSTIDIYYIKIVFRNKEKTEFVEVNGWNENKWYAWLSKGYFCFGNDRKIYWSDCRPKRKTLNKLLKKLSESLENMVLNIKETDKNEILGEGKIVFNENKEANINK